MILPGLAGQWLDTRWGTKFLALVGFGLGISLAIYHLLAITKAQNARQQLGRTRDAAKSDSEPKQDAGPDRK
jgi:hypothetical protein